MHLISDETLTRYLLKTATVNGRTYDIFFKYTGGVREDTDEAAIGFAERGTEEPASSNKTAILYLPQRREDGMLQRNRVVWFPVNMVMPPVVWREGTRLRYLEGIVSANLYAKKLAEFFPQEADVNPTKWNQNVTPVMRELMDAGPKDPGNLWEWIVVPQELLLLELFNLKVLSDISRSQRPGFRGLSARYAINTAIQASIRYHENDAAGVLQFQQVSPEASSADETLLGEISHEDRRGVLLLHPSVSSLNLRGSGPVDFCTCSSSMPLVTGRLKDGVEIQGTSFTGTPTFPYSRFRRATVGVLHDDPRRVIISRSVTRALRLVEPEEPYAETEVKLRVDSLSLPGTRIAHPLTCEDGIIVSETFARKAGAYKIVTWGISIVPGTDLTVLKDKAMGRNRIEEAKELARTANLQHDECIVHPGEIVAVATWKDLNEAVQTREYSAIVRVPSVLLEVSCHPMVADLEEGIDHCHMTFLSYYPLAIGDKLTDGHGNKGTVSAIWADDQMPTWYGGGHAVKLHYLTTPYVMKRLALGAEVEDKLALQAFMGELVLGERTTVVENSTDPVTPQQADDMLQSLGISYEGVCELEGRHIEHVPLCTRRMYRLDNIARDSLTVRSDARVDTLGKPIHATRLGLEVVTMLARGAANMANALIQGSASRESAERLLLPMLHAYRGTVPDNAKQYLVTTKLPPVMLRGSFSYEILRTLRDCIANTVADPRSVDHYGIIKVKIGQRTGQIVIPPHEALASLRNGALILSSIAHAANRVVAEVMSERVAGTERTAVPREVDRYRRTIASMLAGKDGVIRETVLPVFPNTIRAVASSYPSDDPMEIMLPRSAFRALLRKNEDLARLYLQGKRPLVLLKRDPVHRSNNVVAVRFGLWAHDTIGVHPFLVRALDGDFDGDTLVAMFPDKTLAFMDLPRLHPRFEEIYSPIKQVGDAPAAEAVQLLQRNLFASTFAHPHRTDEVKNEQLLMLLAGGPSMEEIMDEAIVAARDFEIIKRGTAGTGAIGLRFIFTRKAEDAGILGDAMELYHVIAQNTLNAKAATPPIALEIVEEFGNFRGEASAAKIRDAFARLGFTRERCIDEFIGFAQEVRTHNGVAQYLANRAPVLACTQRISQGRGTAPGLFIGKIMERILPMGTTKSETPLGDGVWEVLLDYLLDRTDKSVYDWTFSLTEHAQLLHREVPA